MDANNPHNYDCGLCGEPCLFTGHVGCPRGNGFVVTRVVRCWDHGVKRVTAEKSVPVVKRVPTAMSRGWGDYGAAHVQDRPAFKPRWKPEPRPVTPLRPLPKAKPIDADLAALIDNEADKADDKLRERIEKGDV